LALFTFRLLKLAHLYISRVGANLRQTFAAALAGLALAHTVGVAVVKGMVTSNEPFFRTPKGSQPHILMRSLAGAAQETLFLIALLAAAYFLTHQVTLAGELIGVPEELRGPDVTLWVAVLIIQAVPYAAALIVSLISALSLPARWLGPVSGIRESSPAVARLRDV
jgi:hypothetical protein